MDFEMKEKVMILVPSFEGGGAERLAINIANNFCKLGHEVILFSGSDSGPYLSEVFSSVKVFIGSGKGMLRSVRMISNVINRLKPDIIFCSQVHVGLSAYLSRAIAKSNAKLLVREASTPSRKFSFIDNWLNYSVLKCIGIFVYKNVDCVIAPNNSVKNDVLNFYSKNLNVKVLFNPMEVEDIKSLSRDKVDEDWLEENNIPVIVSVGRLTDVKDFGLLLEAFSRLVALKKCYLIILGDGPLKEELIDLVDSLNLNGFVKFKGFVNNPYPYMALSDLYVLSSKYEGMPNSLIQAALLGTSCISTDCLSGPSEILHEERLSPVGDCERLLSNIHEFLHSSESGLKVPTNAFNTDKFCKEILAI